MEARLKVVGVAHEEGTGIRVVECQLSVAEIKDLPAIPPDVWFVREQQKNAGG